VSEGGQFLLSLDSRPPVERDTGIADACVGRPAEQPLRCGEKFSRPGFDRPRCHRWPTRRFPAFVRAADSGLQWRADVHSTHADDIYI
jgi:hypothetical protein